MIDKLLRLKKNSILRNMCAETSFLSDQLIQPIFISEKLQDKKIITGLADNYVLNLKEAILQIEKDVKNNCRNFIIFFIPQEKKEYNFNLDFQHKAILEIKKIYKDNIFLWSDVCLCSLTTHGHCCLFDEKQKINNEKTLESLSKIAVGLSNSDLS